MLEVNFGAERRIDEVHVIGVQEHYASPAEPTEAMTSRFAPTDFQVQYWAGSQWATVAGGGVAGNNKVWRKITFPEVTTTKVRVWVTRVAGDNHSQLAELEAWGPAAAAGADLRWLVTDQLGTPRMVLDRTGSLAGVTRHDYLPFGEESAGDPAFRTPARGYAADGVRQRFTGYERDAEISLDYAQARYYSGTQGRFTSPDPLLASAKPVDPQTWNRYVYVLNRPTVAIDPDGLSTIIVIVAPRSRGGNGSASTLVLNRRGETVSVGRHGTYHIPGLARGNNSDRGRTNADTPFGVYSIYRDTRSDLVAGERGERGERTGTQGGTAESNPRGAAFGTGIIYMAPVAGEVVDAGRSTIYFHGGGSALGEQAFDPDQPLVSTHGCIRLHNQDVNSLIGTVNQLDLDGDPVGQIFVGDAHYLNDLAEQTENERYLYPDLRIALGLDQPPPEEPRQVPPRPPE